jgi:pimeloyl-ACP methyl ester carboxylesterase
MTVSQNLDTSLLDRPQGRIAYSLAGEGPLVIAVPGMGDLRESFRGTAAALVAAGFRVAVMDVRGHGDSDPSFQDVGDAATAGDILALIAELGGPAVVLGSSFGGSAAVLAAADDPGSVAGLVLLSPFLREPAAGSPALNRLLYRVLFARPWGGAVWAVYYRRVLNRGRRFPGLDDHVRAIRSALRRPGRLAAFRRLAVHLDHAVVEPRIDDVRAPALVVVGALDPDYADPSGELSWMTARLHARALLVDDAAHYPHRQRPDVVLPELLAFVDGLRDGTAWTGSARA